MKAVSDKKAAKLKEAGLPVQPLQRKPFKRKYQPARTDDQKEARKEATRPNYRAPESVTQPTRDAVRARSGGVCEKCGAVAAHIHHVRRKTAHADLRNDLRNLLHLCGPCHDLAHSKDGRLFDWWFVGAHRGRSDGIGFTAWLCMKEQVEL